MKKIILREYGIVPDSDCTLSLLSLFESNKTDTEFVFEAGKYYFSPKIIRDLRLSNTNVLPERRLGMLLEGMKNIKLTGNGAWLMYGGQMQAVTMTDCEGVVMENFTIDWEKPLVSEGIVTHFDDSSVDLYIDQKAFPHRVVDGVIEFDIGNGEWSPMNDWGQIQYDCATRTIRRTTGDRFYIDRLVAELGNSTYRFSASSPDTACGNIIVLRHNNRDHAGIFTEKCRDITIENVTVHCCGGLGCLAQFCRDLTYRRVDFLPNRAAGRQVISGRDDGMHITCCSGTVTITECSFLGLMDDPINVHGCSVPVVRWVDSHTLLAKYAHPQACGFKYFAERGDEIVLIDRKKMNQLVHLHVDSYELTGEDEGQTFRLTLTDEIPAGIMESDPRSVALDNLSHTADFICTKNRFGSCRARGVLVSTPGHVVIADNLFQSSGSAILVAGDANYWFESGECHDVEICGNVFTDACLSSMYQFCDGIISVCPVVPSPDTNLPFHKNIRIHNNVFDTPDLPVLYCFSTDGLSFTDNRIFHSPSADKWHPGHALYKLAYSRNVVIRANDIIGPLGIDSYDVNSCADIELE